MNKKSVRLTSYLFLPLAASVLLTGCVGPGYYGDQPYDSGATVYVADSSRPHYYDNSPYYYGGRYYSGGRYETGHYNYNGRKYDNRYYHDGRYYYGGTIQQRPSNGQYQQQNRPGNQSASRPPGQSQQRPPNSSNYNQGQHSGNPQGNWHQ